MNHGGKRGVKGVSVRRYAWDSWVRGCGVWDRAGAGGTVGKAAAAR